MEKETIMTTPCTVKDETKKVSEVIKFIKDGNQICARRSNFINLQESPAGFGKTRIEATEDLKKNEEKEN